MNRYNAIGLIALLTLVVLLPLYGLQEPARMQRARADLRQELVTNAVGTYVENCALCHGVVGEGNGAMPALNTPGLSSANPDLLYEIIAHSPHGTAMAAWHVSQGGMLNSYQVEGLVTLILDADWPQVDTLVSEKEFLVPTPAPPQVELAAVGLEEEPEDPHECRSCHEEPAVHAGQFGLDCARCHTLDAWKPAQLTRHTFRLDHGDEGQVACQTCHTHTYAQYTCYECHDHQPRDMEEKHAAEKIFEFEDCAVCHPTGAEGEGERYRDSYQSWSQRLTTDPADESESYSPYTGVDDPALHHLRSPEQR